MMDLMPRDPAEPEPWTVSVWRHGWERRHPFIDRDSALAFALDMSEEDCSVEGVYQPDGTLDAEAARALRPWEKAPHGEPRKSPYSLAPEWVQA